MTCKIVRNLYILSHINTNYVFWHEQALCGEGVRASDWLSKDWRLETTAEKFFLQKLAGLRLLFVVHNRYTTSDCARTSYRNVAYPWIV